MGFTITIGFLWLSWSPILQPHLDNGLQDAHLLMAFPGVS